MTGNEVKQHKKVGSVFPVGRPARADRDSNPGLSQVDRGDCESLHPRCPILWKTVPDSLPKLQRRPAPARAMMVFARHANRSVGLVACVRHVLTSSAASGAVRRCAASARSRLFEGERGSQSWGNRIRRAAAERRRPGAGAGCPPCPAPRPRRPPYGCRPGSRDGSPRSASLWQDVLGFGYDVLLQAGLVLQWLSRSLPTSSLSTASVEARFGMRVAWSWTRAVRDKG